MTAVTATTAQILSSLTTCFIDSMSPFNIGNGFMFYPNTSILRLRSFSSPMIPVLSFEPNFLITLWVEPWSLSSSKGLPDVSNIFFNSWILIL